MHGVYVDYLPIADADVDFSLASITVDDDVPTHLLPTEAR